MGLFGKLKEKLGGGSNSYGGDNGGWNVLEQTREDALRVQQEAEAQRLAEQERLNDQRQQSKIVGYFLSGDPQVIAANRVRISPENEHDVLVRMKNGEIDERDEAEFLGKIANNFDSSYYNESELYRKIMADPVQMSILGIAVDDLRNRRGLEPNGAVSEATVANFADACMDMNPEDDYRTPVGFEKFKKEFLDGMDKYDSGNYKQAADGIERLEKTIYGKQYEYYKQLQKMHEKAERVGNYAEISPVERDRVLRSAVIDGDPYRPGDGFGYELGVDNYEMAGLDPKFKVRVGGKEMFLSSAFDLGRGRLASIGYVPAENGEMKMRSFYRSNSQGLWRYMPDYARSNSGSGIGWYGKGYAEEALNLPSEMQEALNGITANEEMRNIRNTNQARSNPILGDPSIFLASTAKAYESKDDYARNLYNGTMRGDFYQEVNSRGANLVNAPEHSHPMPETLECSLGAEPNYDNKVGGYNAQTSLSGDVKAEVFRSNDESLKWTMFSDERGRSWVGQVETEAPITSTGVRSEWVQPGALATPLYEYRSQTESYGDVQDANGNYQSMWRNYLSRIPMIRKYMARKSQGRGTANTERIA